MAIPLIYQSNQRWRIWIAFGVAALMHVAAITIAESLPKSAPSVVTGESFTDIEAVPAAKEPAPPDPIEQPTAALPPTLQVEESFATDDRSTPPPRLKPTVAPRRLLPPGGQSAAATSLRSAKALAVTAPPLQYPYEARRQRVTGSGVAILSVNASGEVTNVTIVQSTGSDVLDQGTVTGFRRWRFKPGTAAKVQAPITYTLTGASY